MTKHPYRTRLAAGALVAGGILGVPTAVLAAPASYGSTSGSTSSNPLHPSTKDATTFNVAKKFVEKGLSDRQQRLSNLTSEVTKAAHLTSADKATLSSDLSAETAGIDALAAKVPNDTTWAELQADAKSMVVDYRVFVVMSPQVHETIAADTATAIEQKLQAAEPQIEALIKYEQSQGKNVGAAQTAYEGLVVEVSQAAGDTNGVSSVVLAQTPAGYPANASVFTNARSNLEQARTALHTARGDLQTIVHVLGL
jgi:hypothetical protein